jgi:hypothetical protein
MVDREDINKLLEKWHDAKNEISELEKKCEKFKKYAEKIMNDKGDNEIFGDDYQLKRRNITKSTISKDDMPSELWDKYSRRITYKSYYLTER